MDDIEERDRQNQEIEEAFDQQQINNAQPLLFFNARDMEGKEAIKRLIRTFDVAGSIEFFRNTTPTRKRLFCVYLMDFVCNDQYIFKNDPMNQSLLTDDIGWSFQARDPDRFLDMFLGITKTFEIFSYVPEWYDPIQYVNSFPAMDKFLEDYNLDEKSLASDELLSKYLLIDPLGEPRLYPYIKSYVDSLHFDLFYPYQFALLPMIFEYLMSDNTPELKLLCKALQMALARFPNLPYSTIKLLFTFSFNNQPLVPADMTKYIFTVLCDALNSVGICYVIKHRQQDLRSHPDINVFYGTTYRYGFVAPTNEQNPLVNNVVFIGDEIEHDQLHGIEGDFPNTFMSTTDMWLYNIIYSECKCNLPISDLLGPQLITLKQSPEFNNTVMLNQRDVNPLHILSNHEIEFGAPFGDNGAFGEFIKRLIDLYQDNWSSENLAIDWFISNFWMVCNLTLWLYLFENRSVIIDYKQMLNNWMIDPVYNYGIIRLYPTTADIPFAVAIDSLKITVDRLIQYGDWRKVEVDSTPENIRGYAHRCVCLLASSTVINRGKMSYEEMFARPMKALRESNYSLEVINRFANKLDQHLKDLKRRYHKD